MNKKRLYESIMQSVAKEVKKVLNENYGNSNEQNEILFQYIYNANLEHCRKSNILFDSWIEEQYAEENDLEPEDVAFNKEFFDYCKDAFIDNLYKGTDSFMMDENNMIYCERMLYIKNPELETILENSLGIYWAWNEGNSEAINSQETGNVILYARVSPENVDWAQTIVSNLIDPDETEITIKKHAPIILNKIVIDGEVIYNQNTECTA